jgi:hypothetical protein
VTKISQLSSIGDSLAIGDQFLIRDIDDAGSPNKSVTVSGITRALADGNATAPALAFAADKNTGIYRVGTDSLAVATNGTERLRIDNSGGATFKGGSIFIEATSDTNNAQISLGRPSSSSAGYIRYINSENALAFRTNGSGEDVRIDSSGRLGIGTSAPTGTLHVNGSALNTPLLKLAYTGNSNNTGNILIPIEVAQNTTAGGAVTATTLKITDTSTGGAFPSTKTLTGLHVDVSASTYGIKNAAIFAGGNVGIGTTGPQAIFHSKAGATTSAGIFESTSASGSFLSFADTGTNSYTRVQVGSVGNELVLRTNDQERCRVDNSGRLLVGTSTASATATQILQGNSGAASGNGKLIFARGTTSPADGFGLGEIAFSDSSHSSSVTILAARDGGTWTSETSQPTRLVFSTTANGAASPTERMRIGNKGNTTITSVADNDAALRVDSNGTSGTQYGIYIETGNDQNDATRTFLGCVGGATTRAQIRSNGGLANYQANDVNLSDINVKKDISPAGDTWDCVKQWEIVNYRYNDQSDDADLNLGVIAQQVAESCPEVITVFQEAKEATEDAPAQEERLGVKEQQMYWMAIKALQEAIARIETLETEVAALKGA